VQHKVTGKIFTIPNLLSLIRLFLLPVFFVLLVQYENNVMAFVVILVASLTDLVDGHIARVTHTVSKLGQLLDPFVDRVFIVVGVIAVFAAGRVPLWILLLLLSRDACMLALTIYQKRRFNRDFKVIFLGKLTTALLMAGFCSLVLWWPILPGAGVVELSFLPGWGAGTAPLGVWLLYVGVVASWISATIYLYRGLRPDARAARVDAGADTAGSADADNATTAHTTTDAVRAATRTTSVAADGGNGRAVYSRAKADEDAGGRG
jgi:cardiolipin synthase